MSVAFGVCSNDALVTPGVKSGTTKLYVFVPRLAPRIYHRYVELIGRLTTITVNWGERPARQIVEQEFATMVLVSNLDDDF